MFRATRYFIQISRMVLMAICLSGSLAFANYARLLSDDNEAFQARLEIIQQAKSEILVEYFSIWNDPLSIRFLGALSEAARRGVQVKIILEHLATTTPESVIAALEERGRGPRGERNLQVQFYNPAGPDLSRITYRDHAKLVIVDNDVVLTGGRNIGDSYFGLSTSLNYLDLDILLQGAVAQKARENFWQVWKSHITVDTSLTSQFRRLLDPLACISAEVPDHCATLQRSAIQEVGKQHRRLYAHLDAVKNRNDWKKSAHWVGDVEFLSHKPDRLVQAETAYLDHALMKLLSTAKKRVEIVSPWFLPTEAMMQVFEELRSRGVNVSVITNSMKTTDTTHAYGAYLAYKNKYVQLGLEIYEYTGSRALHSKAALIDDSTMFIGTYNVDARSANLNREVGVVINDQKGRGLAKDLSRIFSNYRSESLLVASGGEERNNDRLTFDVPDFKVQKVQAFKLMAPLIVNQL